MITIIFGSSIIKGVLRGYTLGSNEFDIELDHGLHLTIPVSSGPEDQVSRLRATMNTIGLTGLQNAEIDIFKGKINIMDGPKNQPRQTNRINSHFIA